MELGSALKLGISGLAALSITTVVPFPSAGAREAQNLPDRGSTTSSVSRTSVSVAGDRPVVIGSSTPEVSVAVRDLKPSGGIVSNEAPPSRVNPLANEPDHGVRGTWNRRRVARDPLVKHSRQAGGRTPAPSSVFDGTANPYGCGGCTPPDTTGDVGPNHYVQMVNATKVAIYTKSGVLAAPRFNLSTLWPPDGSACSTADRGDPQVVYDPLADRWLLSQFQETNELCFAVSQTGDPSGSYYLYSFAMPEFPDYFKVGVWPTGYFVGSNESTYAAYALDRTSMLAGQAATAIRQPGQTNFLMPADVDGATAPDAQGGLFYTFKNSAFHGGGVDRLEVFQFTPDFVTPVNSTFTTIATIPITEFAYTVCGFFNMNCISQAGTAQKLDPVSEWPMQRFAYRRFPDRETLIGNFTIGGGSGSAGAAIRWFELRNTGSGWNLYQEGTHDPGDGLDRWMGSMAMDGNGNIALGYSASGPSANPSVRYATRTADDPPGTLQSEQVMVAGGGSQTGSNRWGDYSAMSVDPANDSDFWYTSEYYATDSSNGWRTTIGYFGLAAQVIDFTHPADAVFGSGPVTMSAAGGGSGNPVVFTSAMPGVCTAGGANGETVSLVSVGTCTIDADQAGGGNYSAAPQVQRSFQVTPAGQVITFAQPGNKMFGSGPVTMSATGGGSGNPIVFSSATPGVCGSGGTNGATVSLLAAGTCTINANQNGGGNYDAAPQVQRSFQIARAIQNPVSNCANAPGAIPRRGTRQLASAGCATTAGRRVGVKVTAARRAVSRGGVPLFQMYCLLSGGRTAATLPTGYGDGTRYCSRGGLILRTNGYRLRVSIRWAAPATSNYRAFARSRSYST